MFFLRPIRFVALLFVALFVFSVAVVTNAESSVPETQVSSSSKAAVVATVNLQNVHILSQSGNSFRLSFDITNRVGAQAGVRYGVSLVKQTNKQQAFIDEKYFDESISLPENSVIHREIEYTAPPFLIGEYSLYIEAANSEGLSLGGMRAGVITLAGAGQVLSFDQGGCELAVGDVRHQISEIVSLSSNESLSLRCTLVNLSDTARTVVPHLRITENSLLGKVVEEKDSDPIIVPAFKEAQLVENFGESPISGNYVVTLGLRDESAALFVPVSYFHYRKGGSQFVIHNVVFDKDKYQKDDHARLSFFWLPIMPLAASTTLPTVASIRVDLLGEGGPCAKTAGKPLLAKETTGEIIIPIIHKCIDPEAQISLLDNSGNILAETKFSLKSVSEKKSSPDLKFLLLLSVGVLFVVLVGIYFFKKRSNTPFHPGVGVVLFFLCITGGFLGNIQDASADTINAAGAIINLTAGGATYYPGEYMYADGTLDGGFDPNYTVQVNINWPNGGLASGGGGGCCTPVGTLVRFNFPSSGLNGAPMSLGPTSITFDIIVVDNTTHTYAYYDTYSIPFTVVEPPKPIASCGASDGQTIYSSSPPSLCEVSNLVIWMCGGGQPACNGSNSNATYFLNAVNSSPVSENAAGWTWSCSSPYTANVASCSANKPAPQPATCGYADGQTYSAEPPAFSLCNVGDTASAVTSGGPTGPWTWTCSNAVGPSGLCTATYGAPPSPSDCSQQSKNWWNLSGDTCVATVPATAHGSISPPVSSTNLNSGTASFSCSNGVFTVVQGSTCVAPPPADCVAQVKTWSQSGRTCSGAVPATSHGANSPSVSSSGPNVGTASFSCNNSNFSVRPGATCALPPPPPVIMVGVTPDADSDPTTETISNNGTYRVFMNAFNSTNCTYTKDDTTTGHSGPNAVPVTGPTTSRYDSGMVGDVSGPRKVDFMFTCTNLGGTTNAEAKIVVMGVPGPFGRPLPTVFGKTSLSNYSLGPVTGMYNEKGPTAFIEWIPSVPAGALNAAYSCRVFNGVGGGDVAVVGGPPWKYELTQGIKNPPPNYRYSVQCTNRNGTGPSSNLVRFVPTANVFPVSNAGPDISKKLPTNFVTMAGSGSDSDGSIVSHTWTKVSGPGGSSIANSSSYSTNITGLLLGTYVYRLTVVDDRGGVDSDDMVISVLPANVPPVATAGPDQMITLPVNFVTMAGSGSDSDGSIVSHTWTKVSGPGTGVITSPGSYMTTVTGLTQGTYVFRLTVVDNDGAQDYKDMTVLVNPIAVTPPTVTLVAHSDTPEGTVGSSVFAAVGAYGPGYSVDWTVNSPADSCTLTRNGVSIPVGNTDGSYMIPFTAQIIPGANTFTFTCTKSGVSGNTATAVITGVTPSVELRINGSLGVGGPPVPVVNISDNETAELTVNIVGMEHCEWKRVTDGIQDWGINTPFPPPLNVPWSSGPQSFPLGTIDVNWHVSCWDALGLNTNKFINLHILPAQQPPAIDVTPSSATYSTPAGVPKTITYTVSNTVPAGGQNLVISNIQVNGNGFSCASGCSGFPITISPQGSATFQVSFLANLPTTPQENGTVSVMSNDPLQPTKFISLIGVATTPLPSGTLDFGAVKVNTPKSMDLTITNTTAVDLGTVHLQTSGAPFVCTSGCVGTLSPNGGSFTATITFTPDKVSQLSGVAGLAEYSDVTYTLTGIGTPLSVIIKEQ